MPHKRNPILTENLTGLARLVRAAVVPAMENVALWHERDISHSSVERNIAPDATVTLDFALHRMAMVIENLLVYPDTMKANLERTGGLVFSQRTMLAMTQAGISREDAYRIVQSSAMNVWENMGQTTFRKEIEENKDVTAKLTKEDIDRIFDYTVYIKNVETVFGRVFG